MCWFYHACFFFFFVSILVFFHFFFFWLKFFFSFWFRSFYHDVVVFSLFFRFFLHVVAVFNFFTTMFFEFFQRLFIKNILNVDFQTDEYQSVAKQFVIEIANMRLCFLFDLMKSRNKKILSVRISDFAKFHERNEKNWKRILKKKRCFKISKRKTFKMTINFENWYLTSKEQCNLKIAKSKKFVIVSQLMYIKMNISYIDC